MNEQITHKKIETSLSFYGGMVGVLLPFILFIAGVIIIALSGAPDEKGFWPVLIASLSLSLLLCKNKKDFGEVVIHGMAQPIVMIMISAWILASIIGILMSITGLVEALTWIADLFYLNHISIVVGTFFICCIISLSTGSSFATILICSPILYPAGGLLGAHLPTLAGAIIGGATFGDFIAPISDTTIASALSQKAPVGQTVKSRIPYISVAFILALIAYLVSAAWHGPDTIDNTYRLAGDPRGLPMLLVPAYIIYRFLKGTHLLNGLLSGLIFGTALGLITGLLPLEQIISLDLENMVAVSFIIKGINRAVGLSFFTILLMGLVATIRASGIMDRLVDFASGKIQTLKSTETWIAAMAAAAVLLTTHSIVAILSIAEFSNKTGQQIPPMRRANILSLVVCVFPFLLPYFIPVILMANTTSAGLEYALPPVSPLEVGMHNFIAWALALVAVMVIFFGWQGENRINQNKSMSNL